MGLLPQYYLIRKIPKMELNDERAQVIHFVFLRELQQISYLKKIRKVFSDALHNSRNMVISSSLMRKYQKHCTLIITLSFIEMMAGESSPIDLKLVLTNI